MSIIGCDVHTRYQVVVRVAHTLTCMCASSNAAVRRQRGSQTYKPMSAPPAVERAIKISDRPTTRWRKLMR